VAIGYSIKANIEDHFSRKVGLIVSGGVPGFTNHITLNGAQNNTFTGDVNISDHAGVLLQKEGGARAICGNIFVNDNGYLALGLSNQIADISTVTLNGSRGTANLLFHSFLSRDISEKIHKLIVNNKGLIDFSPQWQAGTHPHGLRYLYLDDLQVTAGSQLLINGWALGRVHLLVRKNGTHLKDSLMRIRFSGKSAGWRGGLKNYNKDYWQIIPDLPEPTAYGASLSATGLVLWFCRRRLPSTTANERVAQ